MNVLQRFVRRYGGTRWFAAMNAKILPPIDRVVAKATGGKHTLSKAVAPTLLLVHTGRASGEERRTPLVFVTAEGGHAVVGTNFGKPDHPHWALNLLATPEAAVVLDGTTTPVRARTVSDEERTDLWPRFVAVYPGYADYATRLDRDVHMFVLEPIAPGA
jgi:deazaflavin-dependent oxidoreductase (nitroreductase family)